MPDFEQVGGLFVPQSGDDKAKAEVKRRVAMALEVTGDLVDEFDIDIPELMVAVYKSVVDNIQV